MSRKPTRPDYAAYIASDAWQRVRRAYFRSGLPTSCQALHEGERCGRLKVDLHHWTYKRQSYKGVGRVPSRITAVVKPWDTTRARQQGQLGKKAKQIQKRQQRAARR